MENTGTASTPRTTAATPPYRTGLATTRVVQRAEAPCGSYVGLRLTNGTRALLTRCLTRPSIAGSNVIDASMTTATMIAEPYPIIVIIGIPDTLRPRMATMTVTPANNTDKP